MFNQKLIHFPWIRDYVLNEDNENMKLTKKRKARVSRLSTRGNDDGTYNGQITDYSFCVNVVFSQQAVQECLKDKAHGHVFNKFSDVLGAAIVLTDYEKTKYIPTKVGTVKCSLWGIMFITSVNCYSIICYQRFLIFVFTM